MDAEALVVQTPEDVEKLLLRRTQRVDGIGKRAPLLVAEPLRPDELNIIGGVISCTCSRRATCQVRH